MSDFERVDKLQESKIASAPKELDSINSSAFCKFLFCGWLAHPANNMQDIIEVSRIL